MTNKEYIVEKFSGFNITEAVLVDIEGVDLDADYTPSEAMGKACIAILEEQLMTPYLKNVSESGFSMSWDREGIGKWYLYLCNKYGVTPNSDVLPLLGISMILDISDQW